jgi:hypothetical protein
MRHPRLGCVPDKEVDHPAECSSVENRPMAWHSPTAAAPCKGSADLAGSATRWAALNGLTVPRPHTSTAAPLRWISLMQNAGNIAESQNIFARHDLK